MKQKLLVLNDAVLFWAVSIYLGTGWSTAIFQFPVLGLLTPDNYRLHFVPQIDAATTFFTVLVTVMLVTCGIMIVTEWKTSFRWLPIVLLLAIVSATLLTVVVIFPVNNVFRAGITDQGVLDQAIATWRRLTWMRVGIWTFEWILMMIYFAAKALRAGVGSGAPSA